jgi:Histidine kinase-, DNA gyrase B-, and HSP90-like ATPase
VTWDAASQHRFLGRISAESARLGRLVGDLLDFSAIESGILRLQHDWCEIALVLEAAIACLPQPGASMVEVTRHPALPAVWADHDRLEQVFVNLLDNAIRHNPPGTRVSVTAEPGRDGEVMITVCDDGGGLPPELAAAPFGPKRRGHSASAGAGLGLSIAQGIVAAHAGQIRPGSTAKGTRLEIRLPVEAPGRDGGPTQADSAGPANAVQADSATQANGVQANGVQANGARRAGGTTRAGAARRAGGTTRAGAATGAGGAAQAAATGKAGGVGRAPGTRRHAGGGTATGKASGNGASGNGSADDPPEGAGHHA